MSVGVTPSSARNTQGSTRAWAKGASVMLLTLLLFALSVAVGSSGNLWGLPWNAAGEDTLWQIARDIRMPRALGAWLAGGLLGLAGAIAQGLFRNPLADPYLLGSASGASLGVAATLWAWQASAFAAPWLLRLGLTGAAFVGALAGVLLSLLLARGVQHTLRLLLAGVIVGLVLGAFKDLITLAAPQVLTTLQAFSMGSTAFLGWPACMLMAAVAMPGLLAAVALSRVLDGLTLGEATARSLGLPLGMSRGVLVVVLALTTGTAVAQTGLVAFVGLLAPHLARSLWRTTHAVLLTLSAAMGGLLMLAADLLARGLIAPQELPVGVLTATLGGVHLLGLLYRRSRNGTFT